MKSPGEVRQLLEIKEKVESVLQLCRKNKITLNHSQFKISRTIQVGGFETSSTDEESTLQMRPTKTAVNKILEFPTPQSKKEVQRFIGLMNTL